MYKKHSVFELDPLCGNQHIILVHKFIGSVKSQAKKEKERDGFLDYLKGVPAQFIITSDLYNQINHPKEYKKIKI